LETFSLGKLLKNNLSQSKHDCETLRNFCGNRSALWKMLKEVLIRRKIKPDEILEKIVAKMTNLKVRIKKIFLFLQCFLKKNCRSSGRMFA
jgi:hypothetical protein